MTISEMFQKRIGEFARGNAMIVNRRFDAHVELYRPVQNLRLFRGHTMPQSDVTMTPIVMVGGENA
jgi:hypothetical protein